MGFFGEVLYKVDEQVCEYDSLHHIWVDTEVSIFW